LSFSAHGVTGRATRGVTGGVIGDTTSRYDGSNDDFRSRAQAERAGFARRKLSRRHGAATSRRAAAEPGDPAGQELLVNLQHLYLPGARRPPAQEHDVDRKAHADRVHGAAARDQQAAVGRLDQPSETDQPQGEALGDVEQAGCAQRQFEPDKLGAIEAAATHTSWKGLVPRRYASERSSVGRSQRELRGVDFAVERSSACEEVVEVRKLAGAGAPANREESGPGTRAGAIAFSAAVLTLLIAAATALGVTGQLTQLPGTAGCVSENGTGGACVNGKALVNSRSVAVSPDGKNVYVAAFFSFAVAVFQRNPTSGELTQLAGAAGCVSEDGSGGACADGNALKGPQTVAVSPDGKNVYVATGFSHAVVVFQRNPTTGALTQLPGHAGCTSHSGSEGTCTDGRALNGPTSVAVSPDGNNVYVGSLFSHSIAVFQRDATTGELTQLPAGAGCVREDGRGCRDGRGLDFLRSVTVSPDGKTVYASGSSVAILRRNTTTGALFQPGDPSSCVSDTGSTPSDQVCTDAKALAVPESVAVSLDGKNVYAASSASDAVAVFRRNTTNGTLTQLAGPAGKAGCVSETGSGGTCADGKALERPFAVAVSTDGKSVYAASIRSDAVSAFTRNTTNGVLTQLPGQAGCVSETGSGGTCADGKALDEASAVAVSPDGGSVYVGTQAAASVAVFARETPP
jgi:DNA-binding beta-propeller fold protein YncE